jgi:hypothetical protein
MNLIVKNLRMFVVVWLAPSEIIFVIILVSATWARPQNSILSGGTHMTDSVTPLPERW